MADDDFEDIKVNTERLSEARKHLNKSFGLNFKINKSSAERIIENEDSNMILDCLKGSNKGPVNCIIEDISDCEIEDTFVCQNNREETPTYDLIQANNTKKDEKSNPNKGNHKRTRAIKIGQEMMLKIKRDDIFG